MTRPLFSVIVVAYNRRDYILEAVKSTLNQNIEKDYYEIMVIKNFSDPRIDTVLEKQNIFCINSENQTLSGKIAQSAKIANGKYLCFLEDDDLWSPNRLSAFLSQIEKYGTLDFYHNENVHFTSFNKMVTDFSDNIENVSVSLISTQKAKSSFKEFNKLIKGHSSYNLSSMIIKKELLLSKLDLFLGFGNDFVDGLIFYISVILGSHILIDNRKFTAIRVHSENRSGLSIGTGSSKYLEIYNYLCDSTSSVVLQENIHQILSRIDLDLKIKNPSYELFSVLKSYFFFLKSSIRCRRMPDFDMTVKFIFRILGKKAFVFLMKSYHS